MKGLILGLGITLVVSFLDIRLAQAQSNEDAVISKLSPKVESLDRDELILLGKAYSRKKNPNAAIKVFNAALAQNKNDLEAKTLMGSEMIAANKISDALVVLKEVITANPKYVPAYKVLIKMYEEKQNRYELRLLYQDMLERIGERTEYITKLCELSTLEGLFDLGLRYCQQGTQKDKAEPSNYVYLGMVYRDTGNTQKAEELLSKSSDMFPESLLAQVTYAEYLDSQKNYIGSFAYWKKATEIANSNPDAWVGLAKASMEIQKFQDALSAFNQACLLERSTLPHFRRAANQLRTTRNSEWLKKFEDQIDLCGQKRPTN